MTERPRAAWLLRAFAILALLGSLSGCGVNTLPELDEQVKATWGQVENQYQRRADLIPNLVATVQGYAKHEQSTLQAVTEARAKVGSIKIDNPAQLQAFVQAQDQL
ncbi:MAG: LemA family protein, partial [Aeromonas sp.]